MTADHGQLLKRLEPAVRPVESTPEADWRSPGSTERGAYAPASDLPFRHLIEMAARGDLASGRTIRIAPGIEIGPEDQARIALAADRAEAAGSGRALLLLRDESFLLDVRDRRIPEQVQSRGEESDDPHDGKRTATLALDHPRWIVRADDPADRERDAERNDADKNVDPAAAGGHDRAGRADEMSDSGSQSTAPASMFPASNMIGGASLDDARRDRLITGIDSAIIIRTDDEPRGRSRADDAHALNLALRHLASRAEHSFARGRPAHEP